MRALSIFLIILLAAQLPKQPVTAQTPQAEVQRLIQRARAGDAAAQTQLGFNYQNGIVVAQSDTEAFKWYRRAADQGFAIAQSNLGVMYASGRGVSKDLTEAYMWYALAKAVRQIESLEPNMTRQQIAAAKQRAAEWPRTHKKN